MGKAAGLTVLTAQPLPIAASDARAARSRKTLLNLGCGADIHTSYINIDLVAAPGVVSHDLRQGLPFDDASCDFVYHSTMLSHLRPADALKLTLECRRVLKPGGVLRIVTEDLEQMCRVYLEKLEAACSGDPESADDYEWMILELYDQATREQPGGGMAEYVKRDRLLNESFIYSRVGEPGRRMVSGARLQAGGTPSQRVQVGTLRRLRAAARKVILKALLGSGGPEAFDVGRFRLSSGQVSYRMYDRYSLGKLFASAGFSKISVRAPKESAFAEWETVNLDITPEGHAARPHALIMEGIRA